MVAKLPVEVSPRFSSFSNPTVIYTEGGIGDNVMSLPALRALCHMFPMRITLVCASGAGNILFSHLKLRQIVEPGYYRSGGRQLRGICIPTKRLSASESLIPINPHHDVESRSMWCCYEPWTFDWVGVARHVPDCDLLIALTTLHSGALDALGSQLNPREIIRAGPKMYQSTSEVSPAHQVDVFFQVVRVLSPSASPNSFIGASAVNPDLMRRAARLRAVAGSGKKVLILHMESKLSKCWKPALFGMVVSEFLQEHPNFVCYWLGTSRFGYSDYLAHERVFQCFPLDLGTSLALAEIADLFFGVDSCMLHTADLAGVPGVGIFESTNPDVYGFRFAKHVHLWSDSGKREIDPAEALQALREMAAYSR